MTPERSVEVFKKVTGTLRGEQWAQGVGLGCRADAMQPQTPYVPLTMYLWEKTYKIDSNLSNVQDERNDIMHNVPLV
ncbi:Uncharacterized protein HZ326_20179 [Fusarium oxysporum f. sp. albedinis]|nr:Uncharacterized protein HZ326_20179 [Fusarium oxysporum f. sp. albedinis]